MRRIHVIISGKVQGVFFRENTVNKANELGVKGWVRNKLDGTVEAVFEGEEDKIQKILEWCKQGPESARVDDIKITDQKYRGEFKDFKRL